MSADTQQALPVGRAQLAPHDQTRPTMLQRFRTRLALTEVTTNNRARAPLTRDRAERFICAGH